MPIADRTGWCLALTTVLTAALATALIGVAAAHAHDGGRWHWKRWHHHHRRHYVAVPSVEYYVPPRVIYRPPPVLIVPEYETYWPPAPSININIPLR